MSIGRVERQMKLLAGGRMVTLVLTATMLRDDAGATRVRCGIGSGITADATPAGEWDEWRHKRAFVDRRSFGS